METETIINSLNYSSNEESKFATKNGMIMTVKQQKINTTKTILSNLKQRVLYQVFVTILMHLFLFILVNSKCKQWYKSCI